MSSWMRFIVLGQLLVAGCSHSEMEQDTIAQFDTLESGRVRVTNFGQPAWTAGQEWQLQEDLRLGNLGLIDEDPEQFGTIASISSDSRGRLYVLDSYDQEIRVFDSTGAFLARIGNQGEGPGEFTYASEIHIGPANDLWVIDDGLSRYSLFGPDGTLKTIHPRRIIGRYSSFNGCVLGDGSFLDWGIEFPDGRFGSRSFFHPIRHGPGFESTDSLPRLDYQWEMLANGRRPLRYFNGFPVAAIDAAGSIWFAGSKEYKVSRRNLQGDTTLVFTLPESAPPVSESDRVSLENRSFRSTSDLTEALESLPDEKPIIYLILPDNAGHIFLFVDLPGETSGSVVDVFLETGLFLGRLRLPEPVPLSSRGGTIAHATADHLYVVTLDELDVHYVHRFRILRAQ